MNTLQYDLQDAHDESILPAAGLSARVGAPADGIDATHCPGHHGGACYGYQYHDMTPEQRAALRCPLCDGLIPLRPDPRKDGIAACYGWDFGYLTTIPDHSRRAVFG
jgi:hypothetical protein